MTTRREWAREKVAKAIDKHGLDGYLLRNFRIADLLRAERARTRRVVRRYIKELKDIDKYEQGDTGWQRVALEELLRRLR